MLNICKASAGSGKTHKLTGDYLKILFSGDYYKYKSILAVTFTNKATAEMKERILKELYRLSKPGMKSAFLSDLCALDRFAYIADAVQRENKVREVASIMLSAILNDYSRFNISTIDKFFQKVLRAFAAESGHFYSYNVNLDDKGVLTAAVDELMNHLDQDEQLLDWLIHISLLFIEEGKAWNSEPSLLKLGEELFEESFKMAVLDKGEGFLTRESIQQSEAVVKEIIQKGQEKAKRTGSEAIAIMQRFGLEAADFKGGDSKSQLKYFHILSEGILKPLTPTFRNLAKDEKNWYAAKSPKISEIKAAREAGLQDLVNDLCEGDWLTEYFTAVEIYQNLTVMGILSDLQNEIRKYCHKNNIVMLSETTKFLSEIIDGSDTPFIYEKVGVRTDNYLLDEFQDTSRMQWDNFMPLVKDSVDSGCNSLIVGDVKQSIYRWRGSDWRLLNSGISADFPHSQTETLKYNWRSSEEVVRFNNGFFTFLSGNMPENELIPPIYKDVAQELPKKDATCDGHVRVEFFEGDDSVFDTDGYNARILETVQTLLSNGYRPCDIAFIVRTNAEGSALSKLLISKGYSIVTEDSLRISASPEVGKIVDILRGGSFKAASEDISIYNQCESVLRELFPEGCTASAAINAFLDCVNEFVSSTGNSLRAFLEWWDSEGVKRNISAPEGEQSIRIITIHKSKGLEFPAVILPFFEGSFSMKNNDGYLWCKAPSKGYFGDLPYFPIAIHSALTDTYFADEYNAEVAYNEVDTVNVAYVAMTRAEKELIILTCYKKPNKKSGTDKSVGSVAKLLYAFLEDRLADNVYESGSWTVQETKPGVSSEESADSPEIKMSEVVSVPIGDRLKLALRGEEFLSADSARRRGIVLHDILSGVEVTSNLEAAVLSAVDTGTISPAEKAAVEKMLEEMIASVADRHWFDGTYRLLNETPIITPEGENYIPDRLMFSGDEVIVVDYKFGHKHTSTYISQVRGYMSLLSQMGYSSVKGYLWYQEGIEEVKFIDDFL